MRVRGFLITLVVVVVVLIAVDRIGVRVADHAVATQLQRELALSAAPTVDISGFPVLTQAIGGRYDDVRLTLDQADLGDLSGLDVVVHLRGVRVPLSDLLGGDVQSVPVDSVRGTVTVPYDQVAAQIGDGVEVRNSPDGVIVSNSFDVLGQQIPVSGTGRVTVNGHQIDVTVTGLDLAGVELPDALVAQLQAALSFSYAVPDLPLGLQITDVVATDDGFVVSGAAEDVVFDGSTIPTG